ncbi:hypothetical protein K5Z73_005027 [Escherichia coli]|nr:hypothetical protein [Escherichia coli]
MTRSDWINVICAIMSLVVTIVIGVLQLWQSRRMEKFERRQDERDERRHAEGVKSRAISFISKHYANRGLIPLCAIAAMHNDLFYYSREMYREFCCMTLEAQNRVLEYCGYDLRVSVKEENELFRQCIDALEKVLRTNFPDDESPFYDGGKYVLRSLERYGCESIPVERINYRPPYMTGPFAAGFDGTSPYKDCITDVLSESFQDKGSKRPVSDLEREYGFKGAPEIEACQFATILAQYIAIYGGKDSDSDKEYGSPGGYAGETIDTMEDLFLLAVFEMYIHLVLKES